MKPRPPVFHTTAIAAAGLLLAILPHPAPGESVGTILRYDDTGRVVGKTSKVITRDPDAAAAPNGPSPDGQAPEDPFATGEARRNALPDPTELIAASNQSDFLRSVRSLGFATIEQTDLTALDMSIVRLRPPAAADLGQALQLLRGAFPQVTVDVNAMIQTAARGWDAVGTVGWPESRSACGHDLRIGMIDTPVDTNHVAFTGRNVTHRSFLSPEVIPATPDHGTAVAALLVGDPTTDGFGGLVPDATLVAGSIFQRQPDGSAVGNLYALLQALDWMASQDLDVLNLSLETGPNEVLARAVQQVVDTGLIVTAAAGNGGAGASPAHPAAHPGVIAVTAVGTALQPYDYANHGDYIDFAAPGVELWTAVPGGGEIQSGTSFAVPFITAMAAMQVAQVGDAAGIDTLREALAANSRDLGAPGKDDVFGWGLVRFSPDCGG